HLDLDPGGQLGARRGVKLPGLAVARDDLEAVPGPRPQGVVAPAELLQRGGLGRDRPGRPVAGEAEHAGQPLADGAAGRGVVSRRPQVGPPQRKAEAAPALVLLQVDPHNRAVRPGDDAQRQAVLRARRSHATGPPWLRRRQPWPFARALTSANAWS